MLNSHNLDYQIPRLVVLLLVTLGALLRPTVGDTTNAEKEVSEHRRQMQENNITALHGFHNMLSDYAQDNASKSPASPIPYARRAAARRRRLSSVQPKITTQCLYDTVTSTCYLNPAFVAHPDLPEANRPIEVMLLKTAWTAYQCSFEDKERRCGTDRHPPYDCRWQASQNRCQVGPDYMLPRLLAYLHCRDDALMTPFWDRCYTLAKYLSKYRDRDITAGKDWCGQPDGNWARCWWFDDPEEDEDHVGTCAPSPGGGVENQMVYDQTVMEIRNGTWDSTWFGGCPTANLVFNIKSACTQLNCNTSSNCTWHQDLPLEYGGCRMKDILMLEAMSNYVSNLQGSALLDATGIAMKKCADASVNLTACMEVDYLAGPIDASRFGDVIDLVFIEEVTDEVEEVNPGSVASAVRPAGRAALGLAAVVTGWLVGLLRPEWFGAP